MLLASALPVFGASTDGRAGEEVYIATHQVEMILDATTDRARLHDSVTAMGKPGMRALILIAMSADQTCSRRDRAIGLLGSFRCRESVTALEHLTEDEDPSVRRRALEAIAEHPLPVSAPVLVRHLSDPEVCLHLVVTDPAREYDIYVSDEAVRHLERLTGLSFDGNELAAGVHRATEPWKRWWVKARESLSRDSIAIEPCTAF